MISLHRASLVCLLLAAVFSCQTPKTAAKAPVASADADQAFAEAQQRAQRLNASRAADVFLDVRRKYPGTAASQEALYRAGVTYFEAKDYDNARKALNELVFENPLFNKASQAKLMLGLSALELHAYKDAYQTLTSVASSLEGPAKERALAAAAQAANGAGLNSDVLRMAIQNVDQAQEAAGRTQRMNELTGVLESRASFADIVEVRDELASSHPAWPLLTFKLARIHYHLRDWPKLENTLRDFLAHAPNHAFAERARQLLSRTQRRNDVKPNVVGVVLPLSGRYKQLGEAVMRGIQLALADSDVEWVVKDSQGDVNLAGQMVETLAFEHGAIAILGPVLIDDSRRAALVAEELQVPIITLTRGENITAIGPYVFRNMLTNSQQAEALAQYAVDVLGFKRFGVLYPDVPFGVDMANGFWDRVVARGGEIRAAESYDHDQTTFATEVKKLVGRYYLEERGDYLEQYREVMGGKGDAFRKRKALEKVRSNLKPVVDFDALLIPDAWTRVGLVAPALAVEDIITTACDPDDLARVRRITGNRDLTSVMLLGTNTWSSPVGRSGMPELLERGGKFVTCSVYVDGFFAGSQRPETVEFVQKFQERHPTVQPSLLDAVGYDSAGMLRAVLEKSRPKSRDELRQRLGQVKDFPGATGSTSFDAQREAKKTLFYLQVEQDGVKEVDLSAVKSGS